MIRPSMGLVPNADMARRARAPAEHPVGDQRRDRPGMGEEIVGRPGSTRVATSGLAQAALASAEKRARRQHALIVFED